MPFVQALLGTACATASVYFHTAALAQTRARKKQIDGDYSSSENDLSKEGKTWLPPLEVRVER
jgi:hypothetical protein